MFVEVELGLKVVRVVMWLRLLEYCGERCYGGRMISGKHRASKNCSRGSRK